MDSWSYIILGVFIVTYLFNLYPKHESKRRMSNNYGNQMSSRSTINDQLNKELLMQSKKLHLQLKMKWQRNND